jgi:hypothetical protein
MSSSTTHGRLRVTVKKNRSAETVTMIELAARRLFGRPETVRRLAKMAGEPNDLCDVHALRVRCQVADLHIIDHASKE